jgi:two-component system nitrate/nitrite response regulator NarL
MPEIEVTPSGPIAIEPQLLVRVLVCDTQPITIAGLRALLNRHSEFLFAESADSLLDALDVVQENEMDVLIVDKAFGTPAICEWLPSLRASGPNPPAIVVWSAAISDADTMRLLRAGVRGILRKTPELSMLVTCLRTVARGRIWIGDCVFSYPNGDGHRCNALTKREREVFELIQEGLTNKAIGKELGIQPGTVKIHMKHLFEKTGVHGRYSLALAGLANTLGASADLDQAQQVHSAVA